MLLQIDQTPLEKKGNFTQQKQNKTQQNHLGKNNKHGVILKCHCLDCQVLWWLTFTL